MSDKVFVHFSKTLMISCLFLDALTRGLRDYCQFEDFHAECPDGQVIQMTHAQYGRMELGRCVEADLGFVGCSKVRLTSRGNM